MRKHPGNRHALWLGLLGGLMVSPAAQPAAVTDGSVGAVQSLSGNFTVPQTLGSVRGSNLFHSFARFGVAAGERATFTTTDAGLRNVITRVTGGQASAIDGGLKLDAAAGSRPAFWFINPAGVMVGAGAQIDVPGSLHLSTAPQLQMADGTVWDTRGGTSTLSVAAPERFGFLGPQAAALRWSDTALTLQPDSTLVLAGGTVSVQRSVLAAPGGRIELQSPGVVEVADRAQLYVSTGANAGSGGIRIDAGALTLDGRGGFASLLSETGPGFAAQGDAIDLRVAGALLLRDGADVAAGSASALPAGRIVIRADSLRVDGLGLQTTGIGSYAFGAGAGSAVAVDVAGTSVFSNGGQVYTATQGPGASGSLSLRAGSLELDGRGAFAFVGTQSLADASGPAGALQLRVRDALTVSDGGLITSTTEGTGAAGRIDVSAGSMRLDGAGNTTVTTGLQSVGAGPVRVDVSGALELRNTAQISSVSVSGQAPSELQVQAGSATLDGGGTGSAQIWSRSSNTSPAAAVRLDIAGRLSLVQGGQVNSVTLGPSNAGPVSVKAGSIEMQGGGSFVTVISSSTLGRQGGNSGTVDLQTTRLSITGDANIYADTLADRGTAGNVVVKADTVLIDGAGRAGGIHSLGSGAASSAGTVSIDAREMTLRSGGGILVGTQGSGSPGRIVVKAAELTMDGLGADGSFTGVAGDVLFGLGAGAEVQVDAGRLTLRNGGSITSSTATASDAGSVRVTADVLTLDGGDRSSATGISADSSGAGRAGNLVIQAREMSLTNEALISSSALASGRGGSIGIDAGQLLIDNSAGIFSVAAGSGAAGNIDLRVADALVLKGGAALSANTGGTGAAGRIGISAGSFLATGSDPVSGFNTLVISRARPGSGGQSGNIALDVRGAVQVSDGAVLSIANNAVVANPAALQPTSLTVQAGSIAVTDGEITAAATGNANAGRIALQSQGPIRLVRSTVRTSSLDGDGGPIGVRAGGTVLLRDSRITTSVEGTRNGNGGDITLACAALVLQSGFVQANTTAPLARGGQVIIDAGLLLPDGNNVFVGGSRIQAVRTGVPGYNVIQAAAPDGVSGRLDVTLPQLDLSATLVGLSTRRVDLGGVGRDVCEVGTDSSFTTPGRGAPREPASAPLRIDAAPASVRP